MPRPEKGSEQAKEWAKKMAEARKAKRTQKDDEGTKVIAPLFGESELVLPEYFVEEKKNGGYKLVNPTSQERNLNYGKAKLLKFLWCQHNLLKPSRLTIKLISQKSLWRATPHCNVVNLVRAGRKQPQL